MSGWNLLAALVVTPVTARQHDSRQTNAASRAWDRHNQDHARDRGMFARMPQGTC